MPPDRDSKGQQSLSELFASAGVDAELNSVLRGPVAAVELPSDDSLKVTVATTDSLSAAFDARRESSIALSTFTLGAGAILGFFTNVVTTNDLKWGTLQTVYVSVIGTATVVVGLFAFRAQRRASRLLKKVFNR